MRIGLLLLFCALLGWASKESLVVGIPPFQKPEELQAAHAPLIAYMQMRLDRPVRLEVSKDYAQLIDRIGAKQVDVAFFPPNLYVQARKEIPSLFYLVTALAENKKGELSDHYTSVIVTLKDSGIADIHALKGKRVGFTDVHSTSGYLYPIAALKRLGIDPKKEFGSLFMLKKHSNIFPALLQGSIDAGATFDTNLDEAIAAHGERFRVLLRTPPIPFDAYVAAPHIEESLALKLRQVFLDATKEPSIRHNPILISPRGFTLKEPSFYDVISEAEAMLGKPNP